MFQSELPTSQGHSSFGIKFIDPLRRIFELVFLFIQQLETDLSPPILQPIRSTGDNHESLYLPFVRGPGGLWS